MIHHQQLDSTAPQKPRENSGLSLPLPSAELDKAAIADMVEFLCSPHRIGRYRQRSSETEVEYLLWLLNRH